MNELETELKQPCTIATDLLKSCKWEALDYSKHNFTVQDAHDTLKYEFTHELEQTSA